VIEDEEKERENGREKERLLYMYGTVRVDLSTSLPCDNVAYGECPTSYPQILEDPLGGDE